MSRDLSYLLLLRCLHLKIILKHSDIFWCGTFWSPTIEGEYVLGTYQCQAVQDYSSEYIRYLPCFSYILVDTRQTLNKETCRRADAQNFVVDKCWMTAFASSANESPWKLEWLIRGLRI